MPKNGALRAPGCFIFHRVDKVPACVKSHSRNSGNLIVFYGFGCHLRN